MIYGWVGRPGSGKTFSMVEYLMPDIMKGPEGGGRPIFSNMGVAWAQNIDKLEDVPRLHNAVVVIDEASLWLNSRRWATLPDEMWSWLCQSRKMGVELLYTAQRYESVDTQLRGLTATVWYCQRFGPFIYSAGFDGMDQGSKKRAFQHKVRRVRSSVYDLYDTFYMVGSVNGEGGGRGAAASSKLIERAKCAAFGNFAILEDVTPWGERRSSWRWATVDDVLEGRLIVRRGPVGFYRVDVSSICEEAARNALSRGVIA